MKQYFYKKWKKRLPNLWEICSIHFKLFLKKRRGTGLKEIIFQKPYANRSRFSRLKPFTNFSEGRCVKFISRVLGSKKRSF